MELATDGEFRRTFWHFDFLGGMTGIDLYDHSQGIQFQGAETKAWDIRTRRQDRLPATIIRFSSISGS